MDIKTRIDELSEAEAKAALEWCVTNWTRNVSCTDCRLQAVCETLIREKFCADIVLDEALKEARK